MDTRRVARILLLFFLVLGPVPPGAVIADVTVLLSPGGECPESGCPAPAGVLRLTPVGSAGVDATGDRILTFEGWGEVAVLGAPKGGWRLEVEAPSYWAPVEVLAPGVQERRIVLRATTRVTIHAQVPSDVAPPDHLRVAFAPAPRGELTPSPGEGPDADRSASGASAVQGEVRCPSRGAGVWSCEIPAGPMDLRLHARGFASVHRWDVALPAFGSVALTGLQLVPGSSLVGWLGSAGETLPADAEVMLLPARVSPSAPQSRQEIRTAPVGLRGLFQFTDLPAGTYRLQAELPGWAPLDHGPIEVLSGLETRLREPLLLQRPARLTLCIEPPFPPGHRRVEDTWSLQLYSQAGDRRPPVGGSVDGTGCWTHPTLQPGEYTLVVSDLGHSVWQEMGLEVASGDSQRTVSLDLLEIEGTVEREDEPVRARIEFRKRTTDAEGTPRERHIRFYTDREGSFVGALPEPGPWDVQVALSSRGSLIELDPVEIRKGSQDPQRLTLRLPEGGLSGQVMDAAGEPVRGASVRLRPVSGPGDEDDEDAAASPRGAMTESDVQGHFRFDAVEEGSYHLDALHAGAAATAEVEVGEGVRPEVILKLDAVREIRGQVLGDAGGLGGARVVFYPEVQDSARRTVRTITTGSQGHFRIEVPRMATGLLVAVVAPGYGARVQRVALDPLAGSSADGAAASSSPVLVLSMDRLAGTLHLRSQEGTLSHGAVLHVDGIPIWLAMLQDQTRPGHGLNRPDHWILSSMGIAHYRLCSPAGDRCDEGFLHPGGELVLDPGAGE